MTAERQFIRKEREHLEVLQRRLEYLRSPQGSSDWEDDPSGFLAGEANALAWALSVARGTAEPIDLRVERVERRLRHMEARLGIIERTVAA